MAAHQCFLPFPVINNVIMKQVGPTPESNSILKCILSSWPVLTWPVLTWPYLTLPYLTWPYQTWPYLTWPYMNWPVLTWHVLTWHVLTWPILTWPVLTWSLPLSSIDWQCCWKGQCQSGPKMVNFCRTKSCCTKIGVEFRQSSIGTIIGSLATSCDVARRRAILGECSYCSSCSSCDRGKTKSTATPTN